MKHLVHTKRKTHQEISNMLRKRHPGTKGLSMISVGRFCVKNGIRAKRTVEEIEKNKEVCERATEVLFSLSSY